MPARAPPVFFRTRAQRPPPGGNRRRPDLPPVARRNGVPERIRTSDLRFRKPLLYPAELRGRGGAFNSFGGARQPPKVPGMTDQPTGAWKLLSSTYPYRDRWLTLRSDTVALPG